MTNQDLEKIIERINLASQPILIHENMRPQGDVFYLLKKSKTVSYSECHLIGIGGIRIQVDSDLPEYDLSFNGEDSGIPVWAFPGNESVSYKIVLGENAIEQYLKSIGHWERGINFKDKLGIWLKTVDTYIDSRLVEGKSHG